MGEALRRYRSLIMDSRRWDGFELRDGDIIITTPAKCGTTWMQMQCALLIFQDPHLPRPLTRLSPWLDVQTETVESVFAELAAQHHRRFIKTHTPLDGLPFDSRVTYITVGRDPRDVAISWDNHFQNTRLDHVVTLRGEVAGFDDLAELMPDGIPARADDPIERFWEWIDHEPGSDEDQAGLAGMMHHLDTLWSRRDESNVLLYRYCDMQADLEGHMRGFAKRLGIDVPEDRWPALVDAASFDRMRDRADELAPQVIEQFWNDPGRFFNRGASGQWREFFNERDVARYEARVHQLASTDFLGWLHADGQSASASV
ncbi:MAG TPA: sulfotransferase domain-containing protein [Acidimicrobiales bacterium]|nr:sulfotransferase domain-containing protein [Acidimicrobiales bacterium]